MYERRAGISTVKIFLMPSRPSLSEAARCSTVAFDVRSEMPMSRMSSRGMRMSPPSS